MRVSTTARNRGRRAPSSRLVRDQGMGAEDSGVFVVVEGPEGAGKSPMGRAGATRLLVEGRHVVAVREPGGTPVAEAARKVAFKFPYDMAPAAELFLFLTARADLVHRIIRPALDAGDVVVADRFDLSTMAYQVAGGGLPAEEVTQAIRLATGGLVPDVTLVLDIPVDVGRERQRAAHKVQDRFERQDDAFHRRGVEGFPPPPGAGAPPPPAPPPRKDPRGAAPQGEVAGAGPPTPRKARPAARQ